VSPHQDELRLTLVDGFAGGGIYLHEATQREVFGSPLVFLSAVKEAEVLLAARRMKPLRMNVDFCFVEIDPGASEVLLETLRRQGYGDRLGKNIHVINKAFESAAEDVIGFIRKKTPRGGRSIFLLDQYGYSDVPAALVKRILGDLPGAEIIFTFAVDAFINFATDSDITKRLLTQIGVPEVFRGRSIEDIKANEREFRLFIQSCLYRDFVDACGARYYTLFFIRTEGHGDYWLVHLSQHPRARDVMTRIHWTQNNYFIHYGGAGLEMFQALGYKAASDARSRGQSELGFCFDEPARKASVAMLMEQLPHLIYSRPEGLSFGELFATTCNMSPADSSTYKLAVAKLSEHREVEIITPNGGRRRRPTAINDVDQIVAPRQGSFTLSS
jgi:three-Cys-motif partner protein